MRTFFIILFILILISGCGNDTSGVLKCKTNSDCDVLSSNCKEGVCQAGECSTKTVASCCGNGRKDKIEDKKPGNTCTCPEDYGKCEVGEKFKDITEYTKAYCTNKDKADSVCMVDINSELQVEKSTTHDIKNTGVKIKVYAGLKSPFNVNKDTINLIFTPSSLTNVKDFTIKNIIIKVSSGSSSFNLYAEKIDRKIWNEDTILDLKIPVDYNFKEIATEINEIEILVDYSYINQRDELVDKTGERIRGIISRRDPITFIVPPIAYSEEDCPICDDSNEGTRDYCPDGKAYCVFDPISNKCGNYKCDTHENKCTCQIDCGYCEGAYSENLDYACNTDDKCSAVLSIVPKLNNIVDTNSQSGITYQINAKLNQPYDKDKDKITLEFKLKKVEDYIMLSDAKPFEITSVLIQDDDGKALVDDGYSKDKAVGTIGQPIAMEYDIKDYPLDEKEMEIKLKYEFFIKYWRVYERSSGPEEELKSESVKGDFGKVIIVEPGVVN